MAGNQEEAGEPLLVREPSPSADDHEDIDGIEGFLGILPPDKEFDSVASCIAELKCFFAPQGFTVAIVSGRYPDEGPKDLSRAYLRCSKGGVFEPKPSTVSALSNKVKRRKVSQKCDCPFKLYVSRTRMSRMIACEGSFNIAM